MERILKARGLGDLLHQGTALLQALGSLVYFESQQELVGTLVVVSPEKAAEIGRVDVAFIADLLQGSKPLKVLLDVLTTFLIGAERQLLSAVHGGARVTDFECETNQQIIAQSRAPAGGFQTAMDQFIKKALQFRRRKNLGHLTGGQAAGD